ncbi:MAG: leucine--tRNA ligase [Candidatus Magasanikbacteria bacterium]|nr:leucine--tRNA ligase [Candidatus Magasanikbacteria bacterium]
MQKYDPKKIEKKWQSYWKKNGTFEVKENSKKKKFYGLIEFPYPSGAGLHVGHPRSYTAMDVITRKHRMQGENVLYPIGFDAFGLPTENFAIKTGRPPVEVTKENIATFTRQLQELGFGFDWSRVVDTTDPKYYKWTQWIFLQLFKHGLAYKKKQPINWCPKDKIGLANEEVVDGCCERCGGPVEKRDKEQWMLAITKYGDSLLEGLKEVDYIERAKVQQENWIGRSEGAEIEFRIKNQESGIKVFTTRPDTIFGATYLVIAPEHPLLMNKELATAVGGVPLTSGRIVNQAEVETYVGAAKKKSDMERSAVDKEKTGVELKGVKAINPASGEEISIWVADYVLGSYGTGAIMAVPAHDERDFKFAQKFGLPVKQVVVKINDKEQKIDEAVFTDQGISINSDFLNDLKTSEAKEKIIAWLEDKGIGQRKVQFKLRDWVFSRQRYWGEPIPLVHCDACEQKKYNYIILHGFGSTSKRGFKPWLQKELEKQGHTVWNPDLPHTDKPKVNEQAQFVLDNAPFPIDQNTIIVGHSLGGPVTYKVLEKTKKKIHKAILVDPAYKPAYNDKPRPAVDASSNWRFDWKKIKSKANKFVILADQSYSVIKKEHLVDLSEKVNGDLLVVTPTYRHFSSPDKQDGSVTQEPEVLNAATISGWIPLPEKDLPLKLPKVDKYQPTDTGESPLAAMDKWVKTKCPQCGGQARRETDTMPNWAGSSWYFLRYMDPKNEKALASKKALEYWAPIDWYNGGMEHTVLHLLYSRFWNQFLYNIGVVPTLEPYKKRTSHGIILASDGEKMSKSRGNVVNPDDMIREYGADALRTYILFMGPFDQAVAWDTNGLVGVRRFLDKVWRLGSRIGDHKLEKPWLMHKTIAEVSARIENMNFNTAISALMVYANALENKLGNKNGKVSREAFETLVLLLSPFAPHIAEELWSRLGYKKTIAYENWPKFDESKLIKDNFILAIQINGKLRATMEISTDADEESIKKMAFSLDNVQKWVENKVPKKVIYIKGKMLSIVL